MLNSRGSLGVLYFIALLLIGALAWLFYQSTLKNKTMDAVIFDSQLSTLLDKEGVKDLDILSQSRQEKKENSDSWVEFYKEVGVDKNERLDLLYIKIEKLAQSLGLEIMHVKLPDGSIVVKIGIGKKIYSRLSLKVIENSKIKTTEKEKTARIAIVIDDLGNKPDISKYLVLGVPINLAVMPHERHSKTIAKELNEKKIPFIMHLPMEPEKYPQVNPGYFALLLSMTAEGIEKMFNDNLKTLPGAVGVSNHMGSAFSADEAKMTVLLKLVKEKGLFYFDSYTTQKTTASKVAKKIGLDCLTNGLFVDLKDEPEYMRKQFEIVIKKAQKNGAFILIGHYQKKNMLPMLKEFVPKFKENNIELVYLKDLIKRQ